jgi:hypothetical protein
MIERDIVLEDVFSKASYFFFLAEALEGCTDTEKIDHVKNDNVSVLVIGKYRFAGAHAKFVSTP